MKTILRAGGCCDSTAQVFGRKAPVHCHERHDGSDEAGSVIVDLAIDSGGNVEGAVYNKTIIKNGRENHWDLPTCRRVWH